MSLLTGFCDALNIRFTRANLLHNADRLLIENLLKLLFTSHDLNLLLRLAMCGYFDFSKLMPWDPQVLTPVVVLLRQKGCPREIEERFYAEGKNLS